MKNNLKEIFSISSFGKKFGVVYALSVAAILTIGIISIKLSIQEKKQLIRDEIFNATNHIEKSLTYNTDYLKYQIHYVKQQIRNHNAFLYKKSMSKILSSFTDNINNQIDLSIAWNAFSWINYNNMLTVDGDSGILTKPIDLSHRDYIKITQKKHNEMVFGFPIRGAISGRNIIPIGIGITDNNQSYVGTLVFGLDVDRLLTKIRKGINEDYIEFAITNNGKIVIKSKQLKEFDKKIITKFSGNNHISEPTSNIKKIITSESIFFSNKEENITGFHNVQNSSLGIFVFYDKEKFNAQLRTLFFKQLSILMVILFSCVFFFQNIYNKIISPITKLSNFALKISKKNFSEDISEPKNPELVGLYKALKMVKKCLQKEEELLQDLEEANYKISKANNAKTDFLSRSSHDIKNYVAGINGMSKLILEDNKRTLSSEKIQIIETISSQSEELMYFLEDLMDISQTETGKFSLNEFTKCDINNLIERIILLNKSYAIQHKVTLEKNLDKKLPKILCDERRMKQIISNLISNAIKYSRKKTTTTISTGFIKEKKQIFIEIKDEGIGMSPEEIKMALSGKGAKIDKSHMGKNIDSHGIGMPIVLQLVELHEGNIDIQSKKDEGTKITLYFQTS